MNPFAIRERSGQSESIMCSVFTDRCQQHKNDNDNIKQSSAEELSSAWLHSVMQGLVSIDSNVRTFLYIIVNNTIGKRAAELSHYVGFQPQTQTLKTPCTVYK